jgi:acetolactate synthase-1/3 small subunit
MVLESTGTEDKIDGFVEVLRPYGILEMARTGRVAMTRGTPKQSEISIDRRPVASAVDPLDDEPVSYSV